MKRDMDLVRAILIEIEKHDDPGLKPIEIEGQPFEIVNYHIGLMSEAGLIEAQEARAVMSSTYRATGITWAGHDFLDAVRSDTVWNKTRSTILSKIGSASFEVWKNLAIEYGKTLIIPGGS